MYYFDASALVKRYVRESGTSTVRRLLRERPVATSRLSEAEIASALCRRRREGSLTEAQYERAHDRLLADMRHFDVVELSPKVVRAVHRLLVEHDLRAGDALQLASALVLREALESDVTVVAYDARLHVASRAEGFQVRPRGLPTRGGRRSRRG